MDYQKFKNIFNNAIFDKSKIDLIEKIYKYPSRYLGIFRPTKPKAKILQNLLQSNEIRFGDAFEIVIMEYIEEIGYTNLPKVFLIENGDELNLDQHFTGKNKNFFIEQKIRDDHDSTKKRGQIDNFEKKLNVMIEKHGEENLVGFFYFIDPDMQKNKNYYLAELERMKNDYGVDLHLFYGKELFSFLGEEKIWEEILKHLIDWKKDIPDLPETNFDVDCQNSFEEIKDLSPAIFRKLFENDKVFKEILIIIFPTKNTLLLLLNYFKSKATTKVIYKTLSGILEQKINFYY